MSFVGVWRKRSLWKGEEKYSGALRIMKNVRRQEKRIRVRFIENVF